MAYCTNCGFKIEIEWKFCPFCGSQNVLLMPGNEELLEKIKNHPVPGDSYDESGDGQSS